MSIRSNNEPPYTEFSQHSPQPYDSEEAQAQMTASYSEISFNSGNSPCEIPLEDEAKLNKSKRPVSLSYESTSHTAPLNSEGTVHVEGNMTHFVAEDLEYKIKLASPVVKQGELLPTANSRTGTPSSMYRQLHIPQLHQINGDILNDLELETQRIATSIDNLTENLCGILHSISSITADNVNTYKSAVIKMTDAMDANIKGMYTLVAKAEEVSQVMKPVQAHAARIKEIKRLVDLFDSSL